jgi:hypothetical protein
VWLEKFVDDVTYESVTVERFNCLLKADDKEHWMSDVDASDYDAGASISVSPSTASTPTTHIQFQTFCE